MFTYSHKLEIWCNNISLNVVSWSLQSFELLLVSQLSKQAKDQRYTQAKESNEHNATLTRQQKQELKQYQLDQAKLQQEEEFFAKWLKQRENLGVTADSAAL